MRTQEETWIQWGEAASPETSSQQPTGQQGNQALGGPITSSGLGSASLSLHLLHPPEVTP